VGLVYDPRGYQEQRPPGPEWLGCYRSSLGRIMYRTPPGIDLAVALFALLVMNLCLDVLFHRYGLVFGCYIVIEYCYIVMEICGLYFSSLWNYVSMLVLKNWLCWLVMCQKLVMATAGETQSFGNTWGWISRTIPHGATGVGVAPDGLAWLSRATRWVYTDSFGLVVTHRMARLIVLVAPNGMAPLGRNFLCKHNAWCDYAWGFAQNGSVQSCLTGWRDF
jgi:hypothetical protein